MFWFLARGEEYKVKYGISQRIVMDAARAVVPKELEEREKFISENENKSLADYKIQNRNKKIKK